MKVIELFAGVGGFRIGLESASNKFETVLANQWEPGTGIQHAANVYRKQFGDEILVNEDINVLLEQNYPFPNHDLLVGGFPCQDYSVATTLKNSKGLIGKKGVLWWSIYRIIKEKQNKRPKYLFLENVDRLLKSPASQRGRDFAIILQSLNDLGYAVEWRVINAADYGMPQRRRRVFFLGYHKSSDIYKKIGNMDSLDWIISKGTIARAFPINIIGHKQTFQLIDDLVEITNNFNIGEKISPFLNTGVMIDGTVSTIKTEPDHEGDRMLMKDIIHNGDVDKIFSIRKEDKNKWEYLKGAKKEKRIAKAGFKYNYSEGSMIYPDSLDMPSRTIITGEGGKSPSRFKHVIKINGGLRRLTPIELERLNMFPDDHTKLEGITDNKRAFFMGNALVVGVVDRIAKELSKEIIN